MAGHRLRDAAHVHGGAGHGDRLGGAALYCGVALGLELRGHLGADQLPGGQRRDPARVKLVRAALRPQALSADLRDHLHRRVVLLRGRSFAGGHSAGSRLARRGRGSLAAALAVHPAGKLSGGKALHVHGRLRTGDCCGSGARSHAGRLAYRHFQLALRLLHQYPGWDSGGHHDHPLRPRPALYQERQGRTLRQYRLRPADCVDRLSADRARQRAGRRLVWRPVGSLRRWWPWQVGSGIPGPIPKAWSICTFSRIATFAPDAS